MDKWETAETAQRAIGFADSAAARIGHTIHDRWYSAPFWARVAREVKGNDRDTAQLALVRAAKKRATEATA